ncbi:hypothetical protein B0H21DRAFT_107459 [Amylocystis lapponica]|nr:hypothetical protein B0H21DRAFT_107459 [Amylocystis lapponica]
MAVSRSIPAEIVAVALSTPRSIMRTSTTRWCWAMSSSAHWAISRSAFSTEALWMTGRGMGAGAGMGAGCAAGTGPHRGADTGIHGAGPWTHGAACAGMRGGAGIGADAGAYTGMGTAVRISQGACGAGSGAEAQSSVAVMEVNGARDGPATGPSTTSVCASDLSVTRVAPVLKSRGSTFSRRGQ